MDEAHEKAQEHLKTAQKRQKDHYDRFVAGEEIMVGDHMCLYVPVIKTGKKLHSPWQGQHVMVKTISDMTFQVEEVGNHRKRKVVHFNRLKLNGEPLSADQYSYQPTGHCSSSIMWRPHLPPRYTPDETDLMYIDETATEGNNAPAGIEEEIAEEALHTPSEEIAEEAQDAPSEEITEEAQDTPPEPVVEVISPPVLDRPR